MISHARFYEKLSFLLDLTSTSNRMLARGNPCGPISYQPSSHRERNLPQNQNTRDLWHFILPDCCTDYRHQALFEMLAVKQVSVLNKEHLSDIIITGYAGNRWESAVLCEPLAALTWKKHIQA